MLEVSYDITVWTVSKPSYPDAFGEPEKWSPEEGGWFRSGKGFQVTVGDPMQVLPEDVPEEVSWRLPGIEYRIEVCSEGISVPGRNLAERTAKAIARQARGVVEEDGFIHVPAGVVRYSPPRSSKKFKRLRNFLVELLNDRLPSFWQIGRFNLLTMSWWWANDRLSSTAGLEAMLACMENRLPEAVPRRYGTKDAAPEYQYAQTRRQHFLEFLQRNSASFMVWRPHPPVMGIDLFVSERWGATTDGFRCFHLQIVVDTAALRQPGWPRALQEFWRAMSEVIRPFYGDVRTLRDYVRMGSGRYGFAAGTQDHPVLGPWWTGVPTKAGHAVVLGEPYLALWPKLVQAATVADGLAILSMDNWSSRREVTGLIGGVPKDIAQTAPCYGYVSKDFFAMLIGEAAKKVWGRMMPWFGRKPAPAPDYRRQYPPSFPFGNPFSNVPPLRTSIGGSSSP